MDRSPRLDLVFHALSHPARRAMIRQLAGGERNLSELASPLRMTFPAATKHVRVLEQAKLVHRRIVGREHLCQLRAQPLKEATLWTEQFRKHWEARFQALDSLLEQMKSDERKSREQSRPRQTRSRSSRSRSSRARASRSRAARSSPSPSSKKQEQKK